MMLFFGMLAAVCMLLLGIGASFYIEQKKQIERLQSQFVRYESTTNFDDLRIQLESRVKSLRSVLPHLENAQALQIHISQLQDQIIELEQSDAEWRKRIEQSEAEWRMRIDQSEAEWESSSRQHEATIESLKKQIKPLDGVLDLQRLDAKWRVRIAEAESQLASLTAQIKPIEGVLDLKRIATGHEERIREYEGTLASLKAEISSVEETLDLQSFGLYRPQYDFVDASHYAHELERIREEQKQLIKSEHATHCSIEWSVDGSSSRGRKMIRHESKLMLRAFNGECDAAMAKVRFGNVDNFESRIKRSFEAINKLGGTKNLWLTQEYLKLKLEELYLVYEHRRQLEHEREEQRLIRDQMREEIRAQKEIEKAKRDAERDEEIKSNALERARRELLDAHGVHTEALQAVVNRLEGELKEALERKARAIARAQLTRSGVVYVLSNIGSFGEGIYKIGMTRRLDPMERVYELGDASVPFRFDVHAMIYCEDAPTLESKLHRHFESRRVNLVNLRREYFDVSLDEIRAAVEMFHGVITLTMAAEAREFRETLSIRRSAGLTNALITTDGTRSRSMIGLPHV